MTTTQDVITAEKTLYKFIETTLIKPLERADQRKMNDIGEQRKQELANMGIIFVNFSDEKTKSKTLKELQDKNIQVPKNPLFVQYLLSESPLGSLSQEEFELFKKNAQGAYADHLKMKEHTTYLLSGHEYDSDAFKRKKPYHLSTFSNGAISVEEKLSEYRKQNILYMNLPFQDEYKLTRFQKIKNQQKILTTVREIMKTMPKGSKIDFFYKASSSLTNDQYELIKYANIDGLDKEIANMDKIIPVLSLLEEYKAKRNKIYTSSDFIFALSDEGKVKVNAKLRKLETELSAYISQMTKDGFDITHDEGGYQVTHDEGGCHVTYDGGGYQVTYIGKDTALTSILKKAQLKMDAEFNDIEKTEKYLEKLNKQKQTINTNDNSKQQTNNTNDNSERKTNIEWLISQYTKGNKNAKSSVVEKSDDKIEEVRQIIAELQKEVGDQNKTVLEAKAWLSATESKIKSFREEIALKPALKIVPLGVNASNNDVTRLNLSAGSEGSKNETVSAASVDLNNVHKNDQSTGPKLSIGVTDTVTQQTEEEKQKQKPKSWREELRKTVSDFGSSVMSLFGSN